MNQPSPAIVRNGDLINLLKALNALDGAPEPVTVNTPDGRTVTQLIVKPYKFGGKARTKLARWLRFVREANEELTTVHDALVKECASAEEPSKVAPANEVRFQEEWANALDEALDTSGLPVVDIDELDPEGNRIPVSVLAVLAPVTGG